MIKLVYVSYDLYLINETQHFRMLETSSLYTIHLIESISFQYYRRNI